MGTFRFLQVRHDDKKSRLAKAIINSSWVTNALLEELNVAVRACCCAL